MVNLLLLQEVICPTLLVLEQYIFDNLKLCLNFVKFLSIFAESDIIHLIVK